ncbi:glyoxylase-like metal-dependent hydrolase (beta-lactamase superfamily II) [Actinoalloteichus hoggarensis]|uniref:Putative metallo-hydrolase n=1 Tax=Actinoalloteichus hoggarensis TaxID=1470176 RepID=A0A221W1P7_9PSEU|nr:MBL fold metallo-hydrolase [Actinoalloteichus hoggarensis]ASO19734.1 putative metallo-hydrolase [Actinoalloteichus hoggarensis]MBB5919560.1 glyoxylase-like metal-dependent hydrolase (beta-lactamase superfamily II) [Actinoalloteichus hoggarensis]
MFVVGFPSGPLQANCYLLAGGADESPTDGSDRPCVIVDPGQHVMEPLAARLAEHRLTPVAVLLTHGHFDHAYSATEVSEAYDVPVWVHPGDRPLLSEPLRGVGSDLARLLGPELAMREPRRIAELTDGQAMEPAGLRITVLHTPGHTEGSVCLRVSTAAVAGSGVEPDVLVAGDTLFAGAVGRTDLPGGDPEAMTETLRSRILPLPDELVVLPGHGPATTIGRERVRNPFLRGVAPAEG